MLVKAPLLFFLTVMVHNAPVSSFECPFSQNSMTEGPSPEESTQTSAASSTMNTEMTESTPTTGSTSSSTEKSSEPSTAPTTTSSGTTIPKAMTEAFRNKTIIAHNYRRARLAQGFVKDKNGNDMPSASNMLMMQYSPNLELTAISYATRCSSEPIQGQPYTQMVENMYMVPKSEAQNPEKAIVAIEHWWSQIRVVGGVEDLTFTRNDINEPISWFTRWPEQPPGNLDVESFHVKITSGLLCVATPRGNRINEQIYEKGTPCSNCPTAYSLCNTDKLCAPPGTAT
uniref:SCP domain-containing protein n=1 Tax=Haemonchus contortus TaxID=6289 RepID=A0A7I4YK06_HAECO